MRMLLYGKPTHKVKRDEDRLHAALDVIWSYVADESATVEARLFMIRHWADVALETTEPIPQEAGIAGPP